jgi:hypothetical protein
MFKPRSLLLALVAGGLLHTLLPAAQAAEPVRVLASLPITYGLGAALLKDSGVELQRAAPANLPGTRQNAFFTGRGAEALKKQAVGADAVIALRSVWPDDSLYPVARRQNIRIVEVDAARPIDGALAGVALQPGLSGLNSQPWLASTNMGRMADVIAADLARLAPAAKPKIEGNLASLKQRLLKLSADSEAALAKVDNLSLYSLSDRFAYLASGLNLDLVGTQALDDREWTADAAKQLEATLRDNDVAVVIDHRQPPEPVAQAIKAAGSRLLVLAVDGEDPVAELESNVNGLVKALQPAG